MAFALVRTRITDDDSKNLVVTRRSHGSIIGEPAIRRNVDQEEWAQSAWEVRTAAKRSRFG